MLDIYNVSIMDILPVNLREDPDILAASKSIDTEFLLVVNSAKECQLLPRLEELEGNVLDLLAWEAHVDFYDSSLPAELKRQLIRNSIRWHRRKGTPAAVEELMATIFGDGEVVEWFDYSGDPYTFQVITNNEDVTNARALEFTKALNSVKNARSWLDKVVITTSENLNLYFAGIVHVGEYITIKEA